MILTNAERSDPIKIGILLYPGAQMAAVEGLTDLFATAGRLHAARRDGAIPLSVARFEPSGTSSAPPAPDPAVTALILPPSLEDDRKSAGSEALAGWVAERHGQGTLICSVCAGAFLLAQSGLLAGRRATTHWALAEDFAAQFPDVRLDADKLLIDDGDLITAGGVMAWVDLGLKLVERFLGPAIMIETARFFLVDPSGREQRFYSSFAPRLGHGDAAILKVQHWLQANSAERVTVPALAALAAMGERTFLRRFVKATGLKPTEYMQQLRVGKARELLELGQQPVDRIAWSVGYEDPSAFRKVFQKIVGLSPGAYRQRFAAGGSAI